MRFDELAYTVDGLPAVLRFRARLTVVGVPQGERGAWIARLLGVLEGTRAGDGASAVYATHAQHRIRLDRDDQGGATLTDLATGAELPYSARHLSLDGRFDWFASIGLTSRAAQRLIVVEPEAFTEDEEYERHEVEAMLEEARTELARVERQLQAALGRLRRRDDLRRGLAELDGQISRAEAVVAAARAADDWWLAMGAADDARRAFGTRTRLDPDRLTAALERPAEVDSGLGTLARACRDAAERRDELVARLDAGSRPEVDETADGLLRQLVEDVEPAYVEALAALADACRRFDVTLGAARLEAAGVGAGGIAAVTAAVLAEVAARVTEAADARLQLVLQDAESACRAARDHLAHHLAGLGYPTAGTADLAAGAEQVAALAHNGLPDDDPGRLVTKRAELERALRRAERNLPDVDGLTESQAALASQVAALAVSLTAGRRLLAAGAAEAVLHERAARAQRARHRREPLPLVFNDAFGAFGPGDKLLLLDALARLGGTTQIVYLTDDPAALSWASDHDALGAITIARPEGFATVA